MHRLPCGRVIGGERDAGTDAKGAQSPKLDLAGIDDIVGNEGKEFVDEAAAELEGKLELF